jgi:hypothetical protein
MIENEGADGLPIHLVIQRLGNEELLRAALEANLLEQNGDFVRFYHDLLRAYFAAETLVEATVEAFDRWCRDHTRHWRSVAIAWSGISRNADEFLKQLHWQEALELLSRGYAASEEAVHRPFGRALEELAVDHWRSFQPAMDALTQVGRPIVALLAKEMTSKNADLRVRVAFVLGRIGDPSAVGALLPLLDDTSEEVQDRAATALLNIGGERALSALSMRTSDFRLSAAKAIGKLRASSRVDSLLPLLADPQKAVRQAARRSGL